MVLPNTNIMSPRVCHPWKHSYVRERTQIRRNWPAVVGFGRCVTLECAGPSVATSKQQQAGLIQHNRGHIADRSDQAKAASLTPCSNKCPISSADTGRQK